MRPPQAKNPAKQDFFLISQETAFLSGKPDFLCNKKSKCDMILSLTVVGRKNRCIPCIYWATAIFAVVSDYSNLFLPLAFFLDRSHLTLSHELIVCPKTTGLMKVICDRLPFI